MSQQITADNVKNMLVPELQVLARNLGLKAYGTKADLRQRIMDALQRQAASGRSGTVTTAPPKVEAAAPANPAPSGRFATIRGHQYLIHGDRAIAVSSVPAPLKDEYEVTTTNTGRRFVFVSDTEVVELGASIGTAAQTQAVTVAPAKPAALAPTPPPVGTNSRYNTTFVHREPLMLTDNTALWYSRTNGRMSLTKMVWDASQGKWKVTAGIHLGDKKLDQAFGEWLQAAVRAEPSA